MSDRLPALMSAKAVAMSARTAQLTQHAVDAMRTKAEELLPRGDALRTAILGFATMYEHHRRDNDALVKLGEGLERDIEAALGLTPTPRRHRRDIDD